MIVILAMGVARLVAVFNAPTDGWEVFEGEGTGFVYTQDLLGFAPGLRPGDRVIAVAGYAADWRTYSELLRDRWRAGETLSYTVQREGRELQVPVTLGRWRAGPWLAALLAPGSLATVIAQALLLALALLVFARRPGNPAAGAFGLLAAALASSALPDLLPEGFAGWIIPAARFASIELGGLMLDTVLPFVLIRFALVFPRPKPSVQRHPWLAYAPAAIGATLHWLLPDSSLTWLWFVFSVFSAVVILGHNAVTMRDGVSRAQILWGIGGLIFGLGSMGLLLLAGTLGLIRANSAIFDALPNVAMIIMGAMLSVGILRYRLFDIDVLIRRTAIYSTLTVMLALVYLGSVVVLQGLLRGLTGGESPLVVVLSTLLIAALFGPLRVRVQQTIDQRFFRRKYDAARTLAAFGAQARDETNLENLSAHLSAVVDEAMQPAHVGLWLPAGEHQRRKTG